MTFLLMLMLKKLNSSGEFLKPHVKYAVAYDEDNWCHFGIDYVNLFPCLNVVPRVSGDAHLTSDRANVCLLCEKGISQTVREVRIKIESFVLGFVLRLSESLNEMRSSLIIIEHCCRLVF